MRSMAGLRPLSRAFACLRSPYQRAVVSVPTRSSHDSSSTGTTANSGTTHFGFQTVSTAEKAEKVQQVFSSVASSYDLMNDVMSVGIHRCWKDRFVRSVDPPPGSQVIDVAGGTGDIAFRLLNHMTEQSIPGVKDHSKVTVVDINPQMLAEGEKRFHSGTGLVLDTDPERIDFQVGDAMSMSFEDESFDAYTIAFGIRNVVDIDKALREAHRVLKPGGMFSCLEFSRVKNPLLAQVYDWYSFNMIPVYGELLAGDWASYQYLVESIRKFPDQQDFSHMISEAGFTLVHYEDLTNGIACIHSGYKK